MVSGSKGLRSKTRFCRSPTPACAAATMATKQPTPPLAVETLKRQDDKRKNVPTAEYQSVMAKDERKAGFNKTIERVANEN